MAFDSLQEKISRSLKTIQGKSKLTEKNMEDTLKEIRIALLEADVNYRVTKDFLSRIKEKSIGEKVLTSINPSDLLVKIVNDELISLLGSENSEINFKANGLTSIMMVGLQGSGKTTNIAKIANLFKNKLKRKVLLCAADLQRPAAVEQLKALGNKIEVEVFNIGLDTNALNTVTKAYEYAKNNNFDTLLVDTAGRLQIDVALMNELVEIKNFLNPDEILLTVDALTGQDIINVASSFNEQLNVTGLVVTKFDGDSKGGSILSVKAITGVAVKYVGIGEKIEDLEIFYPDRVASRILGMGDVVSLVEKAQEKMDMELAKKSAKRFMSGEFTLDDLLKQIEQTQKMGPIKSIIKMIPGLGDMAKALDNVDADKEFKKTKAMIQSMTAYEQSHPEELRSSHKRRITMGSGTRIEDLNKLINQYSKMKKMMKNLGPLMQGMNQDID